MSRKTRIYLCSTSDLESERSVVTAMLERANCDVVCLEDDPGAWGSEMNSLYLAVQSCDAFVVLVGWRPRRPPEGYGGAPGRITTFEIDTAQNRGIPAFAFASDDATDPGRGAAPRDEEEADARRQASEFRGRVRNQIGTYSFIGPDDLARRISDDIESIISVASEFAARVSEPAQQQAPAPADAPTTSDGPQPPTDAKEPTPEPTPTLRRFARALAIVVTVGLGVAILGPIVLRSLQEKPPPETTPAKAQVPSDETLPERDPDPLAVPAASWTRALFRGDVSAAWSGDERRHFPYADRYPWRRQARLVPQSEIDAAWTQALERILADDRYADLRKAEGLSMGRDPGLVPLGPDPDSKLEEFAVIGTGRVRTRHPDPASRIGRTLTPEPGDAIVMVLFPGSVENPPVRTFLLGKSELRHSQLADIPDGSGPGRLTYASAKDPTGVRAGLRGLGLRFPTKEEQLSYLFRIRSTRVASDVYGIQDFADALELAGAETGPTAAYFPDTDGSVGTELLPSEHPDRKYAIRPARDVPPPARTPDQSPPKDPKAPTPPEQKGPKDK